MLCLRKLIGDPLGPVRVLGEGLTEALSCQACQAGIPAHVRMSQAARRMCFAEIVGYTQSSRSEAACGETGCCVEPVAARKAASAVQSFESFTPAPAPASCSRHSRRPWEASSPERHATGSSAPQEDHSCWSYSQPRWRSLPEQ